MAPLSVEQIQALFVEEAEGRLAQLAQLLLQLEEAPSDAELIGSIFREVHTLKGSAAVAGLPEVSAVAHQLEDLVDGLRSGQRVTTPELIDTLLAGSDRLTKLVSGDVAPGTDTVVEAATSPTSSTPAPSMAPRPAVHEPDRLAPPSAARPPSSAPGATEQPRRVARPTGPGAVLVPAERLEELIRLVGESASAHLRVGRMLMDRFGVDPATCSEFNDLSRSMNLVQDRAMRTQMVPVSTVTDRLRRAVRDLARAQGKDIRWDERGVDTELDRGVLDQLATSLLHIVRNAVDHGIEPPAVRLAAGKPAHATIRLHAMQLGSEVIIAVTDDGRGIDVAAVRTGAEREGIVTAAMSEQDLFALTMRPGLSTASFVTDVSGRGVGLDVVRTNVEAARGRVEIRSEPGVGAEFRVIVPITLAVLRCLLVEVASQRFALPFHRVILTQADDSSAQLSAEGRPMVWVHDQPVPVSDLSLTLGLPAAAITGPIVVLDDGSQRHAFHVDRLLGQRDVVIKGLNPLVAGLAVIAGASIEPDGSIVLVLDPPGLIRRSRASGRTTSATATAVTAAGADRARVLVVDDALTVRELQRNILERAGFDVRVAVDGRQALSMLSEEPSDLVLTDVEMPFMTGFELTEAIRAHATLSNIPVLILSSRASDEDRQRGLDAGADGYITKSGFDESGLLAAVHRLLGPRVAA